MKIAYRTLKIGNKSSKEDVAVAIFAPEFEDPQWICRYEIEWPRAPRTSFAAGIDSVQALYFAMQKIGIDLYMSDHHAAGNLIWTVPADGYGFPVPKIGRDFLIGSDEIFDGP